MSISITRRTALKGIASTALAAAGLSAPAIAQSAPIRLGWLAAVTGFSATNSQGQDWGFKRTIEDINARGGIGGRKIEIVARDTASDPTKALSFAKELVFNENVDALCGPSNSGEVLPTQSSVKSANKLHLILGSVEKLTDPQKFPLTFRCTNTNGQWIKVAVNAMLDGMRRKNIAIINDNTSYGVLARDLVTQFLADRGVKPVAIITADVNKSDLTNELVKARDAGADVVTEWSTASGFIARLLNARGDLKWDVPVVGHVNILQKQVANLLTKPSYWENAYGVGYQHLILDANGRLPPRVDDFLSRHKESIGSILLDAGISALLQRNSPAYMFAAAATKAGGVDPAEMKEALETIPVNTPPIGEFRYTATDHNGYQDSNLVLVPANGLQPNGGYLRPTF